jgi:hypothetical protein
VLSWGWGGWSWTADGEQELRRGAGNGGSGPAREGGMGKSRRTSRSRVACLDPRFGRRRSRKWGSMARSSGGANGEAVVVLGGA